MHVFHSRRPRVRSSIPIDASSRDQRALLQRCEVVRLKPRMEPRLSTAAGIADEATSLAYPELVLVFLKRSCTVTAIGT